MKDEQLEQVKAAHPTLKLQLLSYDGAEVVVRRPTRPEWKRFQQASADEAKQFEAGDLLLRTCVVHPDAEAFAAMLDDAPGLYNTFLKALTTFAGASQNVEKKAL